MIEKKSFFDNENFSWARLLEDNFQTIRSELDLFLKDYSGDWFEAHPHYLEQQDKIRWKTLELFFFLIENRKFTNHFPKTKEILSQIDGLVTAQFSSLAPKSHILPHKGYSKMVLRCHLPLIVKHPAECYLQVGDEIRHWYEGELMVFDDSLEHQAINNSEDERIVLMFDIARPDIQYSAYEIAKYKIDRIDDPFLLDIASKDTWMNWFNKGFFDYDFRTD